MRPSESARSCMPQSIWSLVSSGSGSLIDEALLLRFECGWIGSAMWPHTWAGPPAAG